MVEYKNPLDKWRTGVPDGSALSRRTWLEIKYIAAGSKEENDISEDISKYFISMSYNDNLSDTADDISIELEDRAQIWLKDWFPEGEGNMLNITLHTYNRTTLQDGETIFKVGKFEIDEIEAVGYPSTVRIKGISIIGNSSLRGTRKNKTWEKISVWKAAADICEQNGLKLMWECAENPNLDHVEQADQSDLEFLLKICKDHGMSLKIMAEQIVIFDDAKFEQADPVITVYKPGAKAELDDAGCWTTVSGQKRETLTISAMLSIRKARRKRLSRVSLQFQARRKAVPLWFVNRLRIKLKQNGWLKRNCVRRTKKQ